MYINKEINPSIAVLKKQNLKDKFKNRNTIPPTHNGFISRLNLFIPIINVTGRAIRDFVINKIDH